LVFITINLYNFILCILNNFLKKYLKIITEGFTDGIYPSAFDSSCHSHRWIYRQMYSVGILNSPTTSPTDIICRYCTVPAKMTDEFTDGYLRSVFQSFTDNCTDGVYPSICHTITDGLKSVSIFQAGNFFFRRVMSICKTISKCFFCFSNRYSNGIWYYRQKESRRTYSVGEDVSKYITDETLITYRRNMSVGKTVKSRSVLITLLYLDFFFYFA